MTKLNATNVAKKGHFARDCWSKSSVPSYQSPIQPKPLSPSQHKPDDNEEIEVKALMTLANKARVSMGSSASVSKAATIKNTCFIAETYELDEEEVSSDENEEIKVKALMPLANEEIVYVSKESASNGEWCISEQIPTQKKKILGIDQLTKDTSSSGLKDLVFVKSLADNSNMSITSGNKPRLSEAEDLTLPKHDTGKVLPVESQRNTTDPSVVVTDSSATAYDSSDESLVCSTPLPPLEKLADEALKDVTLKEHSSAPSKDNRKGTSASKTYSTPASKLKNVKIEDDHPLAIVIKELNELKLKLSKNKSSYSRNHQFQQVLFCKKCKKTDHRTCDHAEFMSYIKTTQHLTGQGESSSRSRPSRPAIPFPSCIHSGYNDHLSDDCVYYPICELCGSYDHDTHSHNRIISLKRGIKPRNLQRVIKNCETCGSNVHTTTDHNDIEWFRKGEALKAKKDRENKTISSNVQRSKTPTKRLLAQIWEVPGPKIMYGDDSTYTTKDHGINYDKSYAPVARLEAIRIFLAFATYMNFIVYQMDVKSAFLNGKLKEEVYVKQPSGFESSEFPNHIKQSERGISINQEKYVKDLLKKYDMNGSSVKTPMVPPNILGPDLNGKSVNETQYRGMIGSQMYLTASRPNIQFSTCLCARYQVNPKEFHLIADKRIFMYLKGTPSLGLWYPYFVITQVQLQSQTIEFCTQEQSIFDIRYHFIRDHILKGDIELHFIPTQYQFVDIFTKPLDEPTFKRLIVELGMLNIDPNPEPSVLTEEN
ncbi:retrovirus-related pol polyprotein from transposon TNT 1-94 [Tanacetum coccineum]